MEVQSLLKVSIQIFPLFYKNEGKKIGIKNYLDASMKEKLKNCGTVKYSKAYGTWYLPYEKEVFEYLKTYFPDLQILQSNASVQTEPAQKQEAHHTDIANNPEKRKMRNDSEPLQSLRIVAYENKGWLVDCNFKVGQKLKTELDKAFWFKDKKRWFVPARKGNFAKLK